MTLSILRPQFGDVTTVAPAVDVNGDITSLTVDTPIQYIDNDGVVITTIVKSVDCWPALSDEQKSAVQMVYSALKSAVTEVL